MSKYIGEIFMFGGTTPPSACIEAGGQAISRTVYADLFAEYGTTFGAGDGTTTFNVPDFRGRVGAGPNTMGGSTAARLTGLSGGVSGSAVGNSGGEEAHLLDGNPASGGNSEQGPASISTVQGTGLAAGGDFENSVEIRQAETPHNNVQPTIVIPFVIYTGVF